MMGFRSPLDEARLREIGNILSGSRTASRYMHNLELFMYDCPLYTSTTWQRIAVLFT